MSLRSGPPRGASAIRGTVISSTEAVGAPEERTTRFVYDELNRRTKVIDATNSDPNPPCGVTGVTCLTYDAAGNLQNVTDGNGSLTSFSYDQIDRVDGRTDPLLIAETFQYDGQGNLRFITDRKSQVIESQYDAANRLTAKIMQPGTPDEFARSIGYDAIDNITSIVDPESSLTMTYDSASRLLSATTGAPFQPAVTLAYTYDLNGNRLTMDDGVLGITNYVPDLLNRPTSITAPGQAAITLGYDALSRRKSVTRPNGVDSTLLYDPASRLTSIANGVLSSFTYGHDALSNRNSLTQTRSALTAAPSLSFVYDAIDQVTSATHPLPANPVETFTYDPLGNRLLRDGQVTNSVFDAANRLLEDEDFTYTYDANGNLETKTEKVGGAVTTYSYDAENRLVLIDFPDLTTATYRYDGLARRIEKDVAGVVTRYVYDAEDILLEYDGTNVLVARYTHGPGPDDPLAMERDLDASGTFEASEIFFYHTDGLVSVTELTDSTGAVARAYAYDAYGQIADEVGTLANPFTYTSREFDAESGLYFYRARYYDSAAGRFTQEDPIGFQGQDVNLYRYVFNNPVKFADPLGLEGLNPIPLDGNDYSGFPSRCTKICFIVGLTCGIAMGLGANLPADIVCGTVVSTICWVSCEYPPEPCDNEVDFPEGGA